MNQYGNPSVGAMNVVLEAPGSPGTLYVGTANGGVWKSTNGGTSWATVTDRLSSLSIGDMTFDRSNANNLYIGFGKQSNYAEKGGPLNSIKLSTNGGATWSSPDTGNVLLGKDIVRLAVDSNLMLVGIKNPGAGETGLYRSTTGGAGLALVGTASGLAAGTISDLRLDPDDSRIVYASVVNGTASTGVYKSTNSGANWSPLVIPTADSSSQRILLATSGTTVVTGVVNGIDPYKTVFYRSINGGTAWTSMNQPVTQDKDDDNSYTSQGLFPSAQFNNAALYIDPANANIIYVSGVRQPDNKGDLSKVPNSIGATMYSGRLFRGVYNPATGLTSWEALTHVGTLSNSAPHADSRSIFIDSAGRLIQTDDGGIYALSNPQGKGDWTPLHGNMQVSEVDASSWNPLSNTAIAGMQDNGSAYQIKGGRTWGLIAGGDGGANAVNYQTFGAQGVAVIYGSSQNLGGLVRFRMNQDGSVNEPSTTNLQLYYDNNGTRTKINGNGAAVPFYPALVLNKADQTLFALGGYSLFVGQDDPALLAREPDVVDLETSEAVKGSQITGVKNDGFGSIAYGAMDRPNAILAGIGDQQHGDLTAVQVAELNRYGQLWYSDDITKANPLRLTNFDRVDGGVRPGRSVQSLVFDGKTGSTNFYVADGGTIWRGTRNANPVTLYDFNAISGTLPVHFIARRAVEYVAHNGVNALLAGGLHNSTTDSYVNPIYYTIDPAVNNGVLWTPLGKLLPNAPVFALHYSSIDDVLLASTLGRGLFSIFDFTTYFPEAATLTFGAGDNDSEPGSSQLGDGLNNGASFSRPLIKVGYGILNMSGAVNPGYTGGTQFRGGVVRAATENNLGADGFLFDGGALQLTTGSAISRALTINSGGGRVVTDSSPVLFLSGAIAGNGTLRYGGLLNITAVPSFSLTPPATPALGSGITLLQADAGFAGTVNSLSQPVNMLANTRYDVVYAPTTLSFRVTPDSFADLSSSGINLSRSQSSVASVLDRLRPAVLSVPAGERGLLFNGIYTRDAAGLAAAYDSLGASSYASALNAALTGSRLAMDGLRSRLAQVTGGSPVQSTRLAMNNIRVDDHSRSVVMNDGGPPSMVKEEQQHNRVWGYGVGRFERARDDAQAPGFTMTTGAGMSGFDHTFGTNWTIGAALGYARGDLDGNNDTGTTGVDSYQVMVYGGYGRETGPVMDLVIGGSFDEYKVSRTVQIGSYVASLGSKPTGSSLFSAVAGGWRYRMGSFGIEPSVSLQYSHVRRGGSTESGSLVALSVSAAELDALRLSEGVRGFWQAGSLWGITLAPECRIALSHELLDRNVTTNAALAGYPISSESPTQGRHILTLGAGLWASVSDALSLYVNYDADLRERGDAHTVSGGFRYRW